MNTILNSKFLKKHKETLLSLGLVGFIISVFGIFACFFIEPSIQNTVEPGIRVTLSEFGVYSKTAPIFNISLIIGGILGLFGILGIAVSNIEEANSYQSIASSFKDFFNKHFFEGKTQSTNTKLIENHAPQLIKIFMIVVYAALPFVGLISFKVSYYGHAFFALWYFFGSAVALFLWGVFMLNRNSFESKLFIIAPTLCNLLLGVIFFIYPDRAYLGEVAHMVVNGILYVYLISKSINS